MSPTPPPAPAAAPAPASSRARDRALARWLWRDHLRPYAPLMALAFVMMALEGSMSGLLSLLLRPMFDQVLVARQGDMVVWVALGVAGVFVVRAVTQMIHKGLMAYVGERVGAGMQTGLARHLMRLDQAFHHAHPPGHLIDRVRGDTRELGVLFERILPGMGRDVTAVVVLVGVALYIDWRWALVTFLGAPLLVMPALALQRLVRRMGVRSRDASAAASTRLDEIFHGVVTVQRSGLESHEAARLERELRIYRVSRVRAVIGQAALAALSTVIGGAGFALVLVYAGGQIIAGQRTVGDFMSFFAAIGFLIEPVNRLAALSGVWQTVLASLERINALLQVEPTITQPPPPLAALPAPGRGTVRFEQVRFAYDSEPVLDGLDLLAEAGRTTALVGPSGAGKSTVFTLLTRLADPQSGRITIDGRDIRQMDLAGLRGLFSVVAQDSALFDETLRDNIVLGASGVSEARLRAAIEAAHVDEFLGQLPQGLDTRVGPRGSALSGGQRQRVAIARALLREAPILLLDEATSALDARSEALVQQALDRLGAGRTTLVIAHRLTTVERADRIVVMERGRAVEQGDHASLLARGGVYAHLHALQFRPRREDDAGGERHGAGQNGGQDLGRDG